MGLKSIYTTKYFTGLLDAPDDYTGQHGKAIIVKPGEDGLEFADISGGSSTFVDLTDTPDDYTGQQGKLIKVNATEDGLIFGDPSGISVSWGDILGTLSNQTDLQAALDAKEPGLGNPTTDGYVLSSTAAGARSWIPVSGGTDELVAVVSGNTPGYLSDVLLQGDGIQLVVGADTLTINIFSSIDVMIDVDTSTTTPTIDDVLTWDGTNWVPQAGGSGGPIALPDLTDVRDDISPGAGDFLGWDDTNNRWDAMTPTTEASTDQTGTVIVEMAIAGAKPTKAELDAQFDTSAPFRALVKDITGVEKVFFIVYDGAEYWYERLSKI